MFGRKSKLADQDERVRTLEQQLSDLIHAIGVRKRNSDDMNERFDERLVKLTRLVTDLAQLLGYEKNDQTSDNVVLNRWTKSGRNKNKSRRATLEPTGRLRIEGDQHV